MLEGIKFRPLSQQHVDYLWPRLRKYDKQELSFCGYDDSNYQKLRTVPTEMICALDRGTPICAWGHTTYLDALRFGFFGTDGVRKRWRAITLIAQCYIRNVLAQEFPKVGMIWVWDGHKQSVRWITNHLGFKHHGHIYEKNGKRFLILRRGIYV